MLVIALDDELLALNLLEQAIREAAPDAQIRLFSRASAVLSEIERDNLRPDVAFLDIKAPGMTGLELAKRIKDISPRTNIVFVTGYQHYAVESAQIYASGYILKPVSAERIRMELDNLRHPISVPHEKRVRVQCFGSFEVFADGKPVVFLRRKSKELLAYLVDRRGASLTMAEIADILWEDGIYDASRNSQLRSYLSDMLKALDAVSAKDMILRTRNGLAVDPAQFSCDYYDCIGGDPVAINSYCGEYMSQYSWAEFRTGELTMKYKAR